MTKWRSEHNPIVRKSDVKPSRPGFQVLRAFNAGTAVYGGETILLLRVVEAPIPTSDEEVLIPILDMKSGEVEVKRLTRGEPGYSFADSRFVTRNGRLILLTSMSHLRVARSKDGVCFTVEDRRALFPEGEQEAWGIEDPHITQIEETYYITYSTASPRGVGVGLAKTRNFKTYKRHGMILAPENKDVMLFPEKIGGKYYALTRPVPNSFGEPEMWIAETPDLIHWGKRRFLMGLRPNGWDSGRMGGGAVPIRTDRGWLVLYHGEDKKHRYCMGAALLDLEDPGRVIARSTRPILEPEADYETKVFFGGVVFSCDALLRGKPCACTTVPPTKRWP